MSFAQEMKDVLTGNVHVAFRPSATYTVAAGATNIFIIRNGPIEILTFGARITAAAVGATTCLATVNAVNCQAGAVAINGAVGTVVYIPVNAAGAILNAAAIPKTVATLTTMLSGNGAANADANIAVTMGVGTSATCEWFLVFRQLNPRGRVLLA